MWDFHLAVTAFFDYFGFSSVFKLQKIVPQIHYFWNDSKGLRDYKTENTLFRNWTFLQLVFCSFFCVWLDKPSMEFTRYLKVKFFLPSNYMWGQPLPTASYEYRWWSEQLLSSRCKCREKKGLVSLHLLLPFNKELSSKKSFSSLALLYRIKPPPATPLARLSMASPFAWEASWELPDSHDYLPQKCDKTLFQFIIKYQPCTPFP